MNKFEMELGRINAVMDAAEEVIKRANEVHDPSTKSLAKETAYEHIKQILAGKIPWQEDWGDNPYQE